MVEEISVNHHIIALLIIIGALLDYINHLLHHILGNSIGEIKQEYYKEKF
jgi:uncharacterized membrane protein